MPKKQTVPVDSLVAEPTSETPVVVQPKETAQPTSQPVEAKSEPKPAAKPAMAEGIPAPTTPEVKPLAPRPTPSMQSQPMDRGYHRPSQQRSNRSMDRNMGRNQGRSMNRSNMNNNNPAYERFDRGEPHPAEMDGPSEMVTGLLDISKDGHGVLRGDYSLSEKDAYISSSQIRRFNLRPGDLVTGPARVPKENERYWGLLKVDEVNGQPVNPSAQRVKFHTLTPVYPDSPFRLETGGEPLSTRIVDIIAPIGKGQRSLIVSPPKAGKTTLIKDVATGIAANHPEVHIMAVLVGERPEEVTDIRRHLEGITKGRGETAASNFDEDPVEQCRVAELALERAKRLVEMGQDVVILLDSITRLARAYNLAMPTSGRTLSGGFDPAALFPPKKFFGAARNFEVQGSLTIVGTALIDTGSRMDDLVYEEFKGTGNQEIHLERKLAERRIHPAIDVQRSGTRRDDLLFDPITYQSVVTLHRMLDTLDK
jgi:transcription termination factor Rho